jgi:Lrp/AsnC family transcriptional regulator, regulator for asnA, asnC and gidA
MSANVDERFDETDLAIIAILQSDGRASFSAIARELELPESTIRIRTRKILDSELISITATGNPLKLGIPIDALCLVQIDATQASSVAETLSAMPEVRYVGVTLGGATIILESLHQNAQDFHRFLSSKLAAVSGVKEVTTYQIVEIRKSIWDWQSWLHATYTKEDTVSG